MIDSTNYLLITYKLLFYELFEEIYKICYKIFSLMEPPQSTVFHRQAHNTYLLGL